MHFEFWASIGLGIVFILALWIDLRRHVNCSLTWKEAAFWSAFWFTLAMCYAGLICYHRNIHDASLFLSAYLLEQTLSIDNLFVFIAIFASFCIPNHLQHRVLFYGVMGAVVFRLLFIKAGILFFNLSHLNGWANFFVYAIFSALIFAAAWHLSKGLAGHPEVSEGKYQTHWVIRCVKRFIPVSEHLDGQRFFTRVNAKRAVTPLFLCLLVIEVSDIIFAFDSVPAVIAITSDPFLAITSNVFAVIGLRALYFLLAAARGYFIYLEKAVLVILVFIGLKMLALSVAPWVEQHWGVMVHVPPLVGLAFILGCLATGMVASIYHQWRNKGI